MNKNLTCGPMLVIGAGSIGIFLWGGSFSSLHRSMHQSFPKTPSIAGPGSEWKNRHEIVPTYRTKWIKMKISTNSKGQTKIVSNRFFYHRFDQKVPEAHKNTNQSNSFFFSQYEIWSFIMKTARFVTRASRVGLHSTARYSPALPVWILTL